MSHYEVLGVDFNATPEQIDEAYRKAAFKYHPDKNKEPGADKKFKEIQTAYEELKKPKRPAGNPFQSFDFEDFGVFFGRTSFKGRSIQVKIEIDLSDVLTGCSKTVEFKRRNICKVCEGKSFTASVPCKQCHGMGSKNMPPFQFNMACDSCRGTGHESVTKCSDCKGTGFSAPSDASQIVEIPKGIHEGMQIRIPNAGEESQTDGGKKGDLQVFIFVKEHKFFQREGDDLILNIPVSYSQLVLGDKIEVPTLKEQILVDIPAGTQSNAKFKVKGYGLPKLNSNSIGDLLVNVRVDTPKNLSEEYKLAIENIKILEKQHISAKIAEWQEKLKI